MNVPAGTDAFMSMNVVAFMALMLCYDMLWENELRGNDSYFLLFYFATYQHYPSYSFMAMNAGTFGF